MASHYLDSFVRPFLTGWVVVLLWRIVEEWV